MPRKDNYIRLNVAREIAGYKSNGCVRSYVNRVNANPHRPNIKRRHGFVEENSFRAALDWDAQKFEPSSAARVALNDLHLDILT